MIEDYEHIGAPVWRCQRLDGYAVDWERNGEVADEILQIQSYDSIAVDNPCALPTVPELTREAVVRLVTQAKRPASWLSARQVRTFARARGGSQQLIVEFRNHAIRNPARRSLYVVMTASGQFILAIIVSPDILR